MSDRERLARLTHLLYGMALFLYAGTLVELLAARHFQEPMQLVPFVLCAAGIAAIAVAWKRPSRESVLALRLIMLVATGGSLLGIWKHVEGNIGFIQEMHPNVTGWPLLLGGVTGRAPLLASGALAVAGAIAIAATFAAGWGLRDTASDRLDEATAGELAPAFRSISVR